MSDEKLTMHPKLKFDLARKMHDHPQNTILEMSDLLEAHHDCLMRYEYHDLPNHQKTLDLLEEKIEKLEQKVNNQQIRIFKLEAQQISDK